MRRLIPLVLLLAACTGTAEDTTTTVPLAEPSTTTTTAEPTTTEPPTMATEPSTTTAEEECIDRDGDGVLRNRRGFVCPTYLPALEVFALDNAVTNLYLPGTFETRLFIPGVRFTRVTTFTSTGENATQVAFDDPNPDDPSVVMMGYGGDRAVSIAGFPDLQPINRPDGWEWTADRQDYTVVVDGYPATVVQFQAQCEMEDDTLTGGECSFNVGGFEQWFQVDGQMTAVISIGIPESPVSILVEVVDSDDFNTYWTEVAQPILDSIEFIDP